jgi:hypothetical protein
MIPLLPLISATLVIWRIVGKDCFFKEARFLKDLAVEVLRSWTLGAWNPRKGNDEIHDPTLASSA